MNLRIDVFCRVIDHFGDAGVCLRLARQLATEKGADVRLWIDELGLIAALWPDSGAVDEAATPSSPPLGRAGLRIGPWPEMPFGPEAIPDVVIEGFGCALPSGLLEGMACRTPPPVWITLEYLSAEPWVNGFHLGSSRHPRLGLLRHFFFPGFDEDTGGLLREAPLSAPLKTAEHIKAQDRAFCAAFNVPEIPQERRVSLFAYRLPENPAWLHALCGAPFPVRLLLPKTPVLAQIQTALGARADETSPHQHGALCVHPLPFLPQTQYDRLLSVCMLNFVRGEDSFVRAQWAGRALVWQIYRQQDLAHQPKLAAFMQRYLAFFPTLTALERLWVAWNETPAPAADTLAHDLVSVLSSPTVASVAALTWRETLLKQDDLATKLLRFCEHKVQ